MGLPSGMEMQAKILGMGTIVEKGEAYMLTVQHFPLLIVPSQTILQNKAVQQSTSKILMPPSPHARSQIILPIALGVEELY